MNSLQDEQMLSHHIEISIMDILTVVELFVSSKEVDVLEPDNLCSPLVSLWNLEVFARSHCKEDAKSDKFCCCFCEL